MKNQLDKIRSDFKIEIAEIRSDFEIKISEVSEIRSDFKIKQLFAELRAVKSEIVEIRNLITERPKVYLLSFF